MEVAADLVQARLHENAELTSVLATALLIRDVLEKTSDSPEVSSSGPGSAVDHQRQVNGDSLRDLVHRLNNSRKRIWVVGGLQAKWEHLMGVAKGMGLNPSVFKHINYDELKDRSLL